MFKVFTNTGAVSRQKIAKKIAPPSAREVLEDRIQSDTAMATDPWYKSRIDQAEARKNARVFKKNYDRTCPETLEPQEKNTMWKRAKELKDAFYQGMLSRDELHPIKSIVYQGAVQNVVDREKLHTIHSVEREAAWQKRNEPKIKEFKNIMRHLCPDNPGASDIEKFRPIRGIK